MLLVL